MIVSQVSNATDVTKEVNDIKMILDIILGKFNSLSANIAGLSSTNNQLAVNSKAMQSSSGFYNAELIKLRTEHENLVRQHSEVTRRNVELSAENSGASTITTGFQGGIFPSNPTQTKPGFQSGTAAIAAAANTQAGVLFSSDPSQICSPAVATTYACPGPGLTSAPSRQQTPRRMQSGTIETITPLQPALPSTSFIPPVSSTATIETLTPRQPLVSTTSFVPQVSSGSSITYPSQTVQSSATLANQSIPIVAGNVMPAQYPSTQAAFPTDHNVMRALASSRSSSLEAPIGTRSVIASGTGALLRMPATSTVNIAPPAYLSSGTTLVSPGATAISQPMLPATQTFVSAPYGLPPLAPAISRTIAPGVAMSINEAVVQRGTLSGGSMSLPASGGTISVPPPAMPVPVVETIARGTMSVPIPGMPGTTSVANMIAPTTRFESRGDMPQPVELIAMTPQPGAADFLESPGRAPQAMVPMISPVGGISSQLQPGTLTDVLFDAVDVNNNGVIDRAEFRNALKQLSLQVVLDPALYSKRCPH
eukprot:CAMPEP_0169311456 /NCGR_PEP_ID=MMETSP1017-20121227/3510_1 /TAXON_ID=342587 /ORGANISM="Karlodinium micrum, Strain CCMP2283" /LENGTH=535 /DNA_ID=CAMNT_0009405161 /DNA_START=80 /DNA_END=1686 /DNA_ORIENTATION=-